METLFLKLFRQLVELGVLGVSWTPILSKNYLIAIVNHELIISRNDGPGVVGVHASVNVTHLVTLRDPGKHPENIVYMTWGEDLGDFGEYELERILQALIDTTPANLTAQHLRGYSTLTWYALPQLIERLDHRTVPQLVELLTEKGLFRVEQLPTVTEDGQFVVSYNRVPTMITICKNDGVLSDVAFPGALCGNLGFTRICHVRNGSLVWTDNPLGFGSQMVVEILTEVLRRFEKSKLVDPLAGVAGQTAPDFNKNYVHYEEGDVVYHLMQDIKTAGLFNAYRNPVTMLGDSQIPNLLVFINADLDFLFFCLPEKQTEASDNRLRVSQHEPSTIGTRTAIYFDIVFSVRIANPADKVVIAAYYKALQYDENHLENLLLKLFSVVDTIVKEEKMAGGITQVTVAELCAPNLSNQATDHQGDTLGRGLTSEATQKLFREQNPHMFSQEGDVKVHPYPTPDELTKDLMAGANAGMDGIGYFFMLDAEGNPVHSDGSPLSVNDGKGNLLMGGDAMAFMQKRIQAGLTPKPEDTTMPDWWAQIYPNIPFPSEEERAAYIAKMRKTLPGLMNEDGSWDVMALSGKAQRKATSAGFDITQWQVGPKGYIPRDRFKDTEEYIAHLERVIELSRMTPEEFAVDSKRSAEELSQMYPTPVQLFEPGATVFSSITAGVRPPLYIPQRDEPSPFGPDQENHVDNPWLVWKNQQEGYDAQHQGSSVLLREALITQLKTERYRSQVDRDVVPAELQTSTGKLSLGWVIHIHYSYRMDWEETHQFGMQKIKELNQTR